MKMGRWTMARRARVARSATERQSRPTTRPAPAVHRAGDAVAASRDRAGQLLALRLAEARGYDPDKPRGLQKITRTL